MAALDRPTERRWLDEDEQRTWRAFWLATRVLAGQFERDLQRTTGMSMTHYELLVQLSEAPGRTLRMRDLARFSQVSRSALSHAVTRLVANGWIERLPSPEDGRGAFAVLTDEGFAALEAAAPSHVASVRAHLFDSLDADQVAQLGAVSEQLMAHFRDEGLCPREGEINGLVDDEC